MTGNQPAAPVVLDLERHKETCSACRVRALCSVGQAIVKAAGTALIDSGGTKRMGRA